jgi:hypothetical protein
MIFGLSLLVIIACFGMIFWSGRDFADKRRVRGSVLLAAGILIGMASIAALASTVP